MEEKRLNKCCACNQNKVHLEDHLKCRHSVIGVINSIRDVKIRQIVQRDKTLMEYIKYRLTVSTVVGLDKGESYIRNDIVLVVRLMKIAWEKLDNDDYQDLTISNLMILAHAQVIKDSLVQLATEHSRTYPRKVISILRTCAKLTGTESDFSITCNEIVEFQQARNFSGERRRSHLADVGSDDEELGLPSKRRRRVYISSEEESNDSIGDNEELDNDNSIEELSGEDSVQPQSDDDEQVVSKSHDPTLSIDSLNNLSLILSRVDEPQSDCLHDFLQAKQRLEEAEVHKVIAEQLIVESDQQSNEFLNDSPNGQSSSLDPPEELVRIFEDENQQQSKAPEGSCEEVNGTLDTLQKHLNSIKSQMKSIKFSVSLNENRLEEQQKEQRLLQLDLESLRPRVEAVTALLLESSDSSSVHTIENRVKEMQNEYVNLIAESIHRGKFLEEISKELYEFLTEITKYELEYSQTKSRTPSELNLGDCEAGIGQLTTKLDEQQFDFEMVIKKEKNLVDRENIIDAADIRAKIGVLETRLNEMNNAPHEKSSTSKVDDLTSQLDSQRSLFGEIACTQLCEALSNVKIPMQSKLTEIEELFIELQEKFQHQKTKTEENLRDRREFETSCSEILGWLASELQNIPEKLLISANQAIIQQQLDKYKKIHDAVKIKKNQVMELMDKGKDIMMKASKTEKEAIKEDLDKMQTQLDLLKKMIFDKRIELETCAEHCQKYYRDFNSLSSSVQETQVQLQNLMTPKSLTGSVSDTGLDEHIQALNLFGVNVLKRSEAFKDLMLLGKTILNSCDIDTDIVENGLKNMENRWLMLFVALKDYIMFNKRLSNLRTGLLLYETFYTNFEDFSKDGIKELREEIKTLVKDLQIVKELAKKLVSLPAADDLVIDVSDRICDLCGRLDNLISA